MYDGVAVVSLTSFLRRCLSKLFMFPVDGNSTHAHRHTGITLHTYLGSFAGIKVAVAVAVAVAEANDASI